MTGQKVLVFSIGLIGYADIFRRCIQSHHVYCERYGYDYVLIDRFPGFPDKEESAWLKIILMIRALKGGYRWVFFVDSDCEIQSHTPPIESLETVSKSIYLAPGHSGFINSGVLIAKSCAESINFFERVLADAGRKIPELSIINWGENPYVIHHAQDNPNIHVLTHDWNNNTNLTPKSYIFHYSSGTFRQLYLNQYSSKIAQLKGKVLRKFYAACLRLFPKQGSLTNRLHSYLNFYQQYYPVFSPKILRVAEKFSRNQ